MKTNLKTKILDKDVPTLLEQLDNFTEEIGDLTQIVEHTETLRQFRYYCKQKHKLNNVICEINRYEDLVSIDAQGSVIKADNLIQIRYVDPDKSTIQNAL